MAGRFRNERLRLSQLILARLLTVATAARKYAPPARIEKSAPQPPRCLDRNHQQGANHKHHAERAKNIKQKPQDIGGCPHPLNIPAIAQKCLPQRRSSLGPLNPPRNAGHVVLGLSGNDVLAKLGRFPRGT